MRRSATARSGCYAARMTPLTAVIWDFDGTLVDTTAKNLAVTRALLHEVIGPDAADVPALRDLHSYRAALRQHRGWRDFYRNDLRLTDDQALQAGSRWLEFQLRDDTRPPPIDGVPTVLEALAHLPQAIVSLNARDNILRLVSEIGIGHHFHTVLGFEAVPVEHQKPEPHALLLCIEQLTRMQPGRVLYIGDHESDTRCVAAANGRLRADGTPVHVLAVAALFDESASDGSWTTAPDYRARHPADVLEIVAGLSGLSS